MLHAKCARVGHSTRGRGERVRQDVGSERRTRIARPLVLAIGLAFPSLGFAATIIVPADRATIQAAVDAAGAGDTVLVQPGTYAGAVRIGSAHRGLALAATDPDDPPVLTGGGSRSATVTIDGADDVTLDSLAIEGPADGVSVTDARGVQLIDLAIAGARTAIRVRGGGLVQIASCDVDGTRGGPGIRIENARDVVVSDVTSDDTRREGLLARNAPGITLLRTFVTGARGRAGIKLVRAPDATLVECTATSNRRDGIRVQRSASLGLRDNDADGNMKAGMRIERSHPFFTLADVMAGNNEASANGGRDVIVMPPRCNRRRCPRTTTTTVPPGTGVTTTTTRPGIPATVTTTTATTTSMTTTSGPLFAVNVRLYVRIPHAGVTFREANVPYRSIEEPLAVGIRPEHVDAFRVDDQVMIDELVALGGDTYARLTNAAAAYMAAHPADYPDFAGTVEVRWAKRAP